MGFSPASSRRKWRRFFPKWSAPCAKKVGSETLEDFHLLNTSGLMPHVVAGIQALKAENDALRKRASELEKRLEKLEKATLEIVALPE